MDPRHAIQRQAARRTAWTVGTIAVAVYLLFILSGVIGRGG